MDEVREWVKRARRDFKAARINLKQGLYDVSTFLLHQSLEKALKALYLKKIQGTHKNT
jgi:HEPN domain-containing protein